MEYSGYGATVGSAGGGVGTIVGTFLGVAVGTVAGFSEDTTDAAKKNLNLQTGDNLDEDLREIAALFSMSLISDNYGSKDGITKYSPRSGDIEGTWEPVE